MKALVIVGGTIAAIFLAWLACFMLCRWLLITK